MQIILPVVERSVTIAGISTRELVAKDFATEPHEEKLRRAGHLMAQKLAGSLALVTCKEPLKSNLATHLRQQLTDHGFNDVGFHPISIVSILTGLLLSSKWFLNRSYPYLFKIILISLVLLLRRQRWSARSRTSTKVLPPPMKCADVIERSNILLFWLCPFVLMEFDDPASQYAAVLGSIRSALQF